MDSSKTVAIITMSDSRFADNDKPDLSGSAARQLVEDAGYKVVFYRLIRDDFVQIKQTLLEASAKQIALILTTGGTGLAPSDQTPEATKAILDKEVVGISEAMRHYSMQLTPRAMLSRSVCGIREQSLIINLPGSPKAVRENLAYILPTLEHAIAILQQAVRDCGKA